MLKIWLILADTDTDIKIGASLLVCALVMHRLSVRYRLSALSAQKSDNRYRLKFSRYFICIHNSIRREYIVILVAKYLSFSLNFTEKALNI